MRTEHSRDFRYTFSKEEWETVDKNMRERGMWTFGIKLNMFETIHFIFEIPKEDKEDG